jgi:YggT family protein
MLVDLVRIAFSVLNLLIIARVLLSWIPFGNPNSPVIRFIYETTEPILAPIRRIIHTGALPLDFSPIIAILLISMVEKWVIILLFRFF